MIGQKCLQSEVVRVAILLVGLRSTCCFEFTSSPRNPLVVVKGINTTNVSLKWKFSLSVADDKFSILRITRYQQAMAIGTTLISYDSHGDQVHLVNSSFYMSLNASASRNQPSGYVVLTLNDVLIQPNNEDGSLYIPTSHTYVYELSLSFTNIHDDSPKTKNKTELHVHYKPMQLEVVNIQGGVLVFNEGQPISITCKAKGNPEPNYLWKVGDKNSNNKTFIINNVTRDDAGVYTCTAVNSVGSESISVTLHVRYLGNTRCVAQPDPVKEYNKIALNCSAEGYPPASYTWTVANKVYHGPTATVIANRSLNGVIMTCKATNAVGMGNCSTAVTVHCSGYTESPIITYPTNKDCKSISVNEGEDFSIICHATGVPNPTISWKKDGQVLGNCSSLTLNNVKKNQAGNYTCTADNGIGKPDTACWNVNIKYFQGCKEETLEVTTGAVNGQCVSVQRDGNPVPTLSCSPRGNLNITQNGGEYILCGVKDTVSNCTIANDVGRCSFAVKSYQQINQYVYKGSFKCSSCNYDKGLDDSNSGLFNATKDKMEKLLTSIYEVHKYVTSIEVIYFRPGSIIVVFQLHMVANVSKPLSPLKESVIKNGGSLNGLTIDPCSIQRGDDDPPSTASTCQSAPSVTPECFQVPALVLGVILGISLILNFVLIGCFVWKHRKEIKERPNDRTNSNDDSGLTNAIALQDQPPSDSQDVVQYATVGNERDQKSITNTAMYQSVKPHSDTYSSLSPSTKLPTKPAVMTNSGDYQDLQGAPHQYQSLDNFSRV